MSRAIIITKDKPGETVAIIPEFNSHLSISIIIMYCLCNNIVMTSMYAITICTSTTVANRLENKDQVVKSYLYCMAKFPIKCLFIFCV